MFLLLLLASYIPLVDRADSHYNLPVAKVSNIWQTVTWIDNMDELWGAWEPNGNERWARCRIPYDTPFMVGKRGENPIKLIGSVYLREIRMGGGSTYSIGKSKGAMHTFGAAV